MVDQIFPAQMQATPAKPDPGMAVIRSATPSPKPGWKTSEFAGHAAAMLLTLLFASGLLTNQTAIQIAGIAAAWLGSLGYTVNRTLLKAGTGLLLVALLAAPQVACSNSGARAQNAGSEALGCGTPLAVSLGVQLKAPLLEALTGAVSGDGLHVDRAKLKAIAEPMLTPALRCAFDAAVAYFLKPAPARAGAPAAAPLAVDPAAFHAAWDPVRSELGWPTLDMP